MSDAPARTTADLSGYPDLVVIYLGKRVRGGGEQPDGLLLHERLRYSEGPLHVGMRQYWRDFDTLLAWTLPHKRRWSEYLNADRAEAVSA